MLGFFEWSHSNILFVDRTRRSVDSGKRTCMNAFTDDIPIALLQRVRGEFTEMPGLYLTPVQAARLLGSGRGAQRKADAGSGSH